MKLGGWTNVTKAPAGRQDMCATATKLVAAVPRSGTSKLYAWARLDAAPRVACELDGLVVRLHPVPGTESVIARAVPSWPFLPDGAPLGMHFDNTDIPAVFEQKRAALATLGDDTVLVVVDTDTGATRELARSDATFSIGDVVAAPDGVAFAISGSRRAEDAPGGHAWSTRIVDRAGGVVAEHAIADEALCPHSWDASELVLYSRVFRFPEPKHLFRIVDGVVVRGAPDGLVSPDGAFRVRLAAGTLTVAARGGEPRSVAVATGLAKRALAKLGTLPSGLATDATWWWGPRRLVLDDPDPHVLDLESLELARMLPRAADGHPVGDGSGRWLVAELDGKLQSAAST